MQLRESNMHKLPSTTYDVLIIGGGINGAVSAAALASRGVKVALIEQRDFAGFTSQQSSNLAWGGIKYLETLEFSLVRNLCLARNQLLRYYPSTVQEIRFLITIPRDFRHHLATLWFGTWLYWAMGNSFTQTPRLLLPRQICQEEGIINVENSQGGIEYSDAYFADTDARFVFSFIRTALDRGGIVANYVEALGSSRTNNAWTTRAREVLTGRVFAIQSKVVINAAGPFVDELNIRNGQSTEHQHVFSKGVHLIVHQLTPQRRVLSFFADDGRLFFAIPLRDKTCIGTTDTWVESPYTAVTDADRQFLLDNINTRLRLDAPLTTSDIIAERCGVRPLAVKKGATQQTDFLQLSRKHVVEVNHPEAYISIFGGKLTDCLNVGEEICQAVQQLGIAIPYPHYRWYGEPPAVMHQEFLHQARLLELDKYTPPDAFESLTTRLWRRYGIDALTLLEQIRVDPVQAEIAIKGTECLRCELYHAARREMIVTFEDFLRRRSEIALVTDREVLHKSSGLVEACTILFGDKAQAKLEEYFRNKE
jgi:glycerol-3-phosphate dehydrogenase